jgi:hypothetical protein
LQSSSTALLHDEELNTASIVSTDVLVPATAMVALPLRLGVQRYARSARAPAAPQLNGVWLATFEPKVNVREPPVAAIVSGLLHDSAAPPEVMQVLAEHVMPVVQILPQTPQLSMSVVTSVHTPLQIMLGAVQLERHTRSMQVSPKSHGVPHPPQFNSSVEVSTQVPLQLVCDPVQLDRQLLAVQVSPVSHGMKHPPQLLRSVRVSTQVSPHIVNGSVHEVIVTQSDA